jgi:hypothetical protein
VDSRVARVSNDRLQTQPGQVRQEIEKTTNWPEYEAGIRQRGSLTVWISEDELKGWGPPKRNQRKPGAQEQLLAAES